MLYNLQNKTIAIEFEHVANQDLLAENNSVFIVDEKVYELHPSMLPEKIESTKVYRYYASELTKNNDSLTKIYDFLYEHKVGRDTILYAIGGGITTDLAGFAASTFKRGVRLRLVPTTLLAMVDAAIGGKTGFNYRECKNIIGSFYPAEQIIIDTNFLETLSDEHRQSGMVEIVKMSFLPQSQLDTVLDAKVGLDEIIKTAIRTKMDICSQDLRDKGIRQHLNLGHTFAHILESVSNYKISHGFAVAIGLRAAAIFSRKKLFISDNQFQQIQDKLDRFKLPRTYPKKYVEKIRRDGEAILKHDKKKKAKTILILFNNNCEPFIYETNQKDEILQSLIQLNDDKT